MGLWQIFILNRRGMNTSLVLLKKMEAVQKMKIMYIQSLNIKQDLDVILNGMRNLSWELL